MYYSDDTTTSLGGQGEEDKTLILNGTQRLRYFAEEYHRPAEQKPLSQRKSSLLQRLVAMIRH